MKKFFILFLFLITGCVFNPKHYRREISSEPTYPEKTTVTSSLDWPVQAAKMTRGFLPQKRKPHWGIDLAAPKGTLVYSAHEGTVIYTGRAFSGFGKMIMIQAPGTNQNTFATLYAHLSKITVKQGLFVTANTVLGEIGNTGRSTGNHLHFEVRKKSGPVDPLLYLPQNYALNLISNE